MSESRPTPPEVKKQLREHARYGCCRCGFPVYEYHHIIPYSVEEHFRVEDMMILCPICHDMVTKGAIADDQQREIQRNPHNRRHGYASGMLHVNQGYCAVRTGGVLLIGEGPLVAIDGEPLLALRAGDDGMMQLSLTLYDSLDNLLAEIQDNEWVSGDPSVWDMESDYQKLTIRSDRHKVALRINAKREPMDIRAQLWRSGHRVDLRGIGVKIDGGNLIRQTISNLAYMDMAFHVDTRQQITRIEPISGFGAIVSGADEIERFNNAIRGWHDSRRKGG